MESEGEFDPHLTQISTQWTLIYRAHRGTPEQVASAQFELLARYVGAVHRYLLAALRDRDAAEELNQDFAVRFLRGDFHRADPAHGRFRDFLKRALRNLMIDHLRRRKARPIAMGDALPEPSVPEPDVAEFDRSFVASWRADLMARAWDALADLQERTGQPYHKALKLRVENPDLRSHALAERLAISLGRPIGPGAWRMTLQRARDRFVGFLLDEVAGAMDDPSPQELEEELIALDLHDYCKPAMDRLMPPSDERRRTGPRS